MNRGGLPLMWSASVGVTVPLWAGKKQRPLIVEAERLASVRRRHGGVAPAPRRGA